jgi:hypothetical protein
MADLLSKQEEADAQKYIEDLLGLRDTKNLFGKGAMTASALIKSFNIWRDEEKRNAALSGLPYKGRYGYSDVRDIQKGLLGKYPHIDVDKILGFFVKDKEENPLGLKDVGGESAAYIAMMKHSKDTLDPYDMFAFWKKNPDKEAITNSLMDLDFITEIKPQVADPWVNPDQ